ncbi:hypothetical protein N836_07150 [Leptolyngbya sp. Heron Island J]|uniref:hypothetical protein n=1 Tax=Leptolyngbya sp. Heron Island J TaxID=1385935 RepID=UPI0003B94563|nr:hypothetical protein [Leptolyngbya sp. Heron Island J]ESA36543.1 hypothetical protein N836_07150 [Leptolyngbya sp. Heron Island J]
MASGVDPRQGIHPSAGETPLSDERFNMLDSSTGFSSGQTEGAQKLETVSVALSFEDLGKYFIRLSAYGLDHLDEIYDSLPDDYKDSFAIFVHKEYLQDLFTTLSAAGGWLITNNGDAWADIEEEFRPSPAFVEGIHQEHFTPTGINWHELTGFFGGLCDQFETANYEHHAPFEGDPCVLDTLAQYRGRVQYVPNEKILPDEIMVAALAPLFEQANQAANLETLERARADSNVASSFTALSAPLQLADYEQLDMVDDSFEITSQTLSREELAQFLIRLSAYGLDHLDEIYESSPREYKGVSYSPYGNKNRLELLFSELGSSGAWMQFNCFDEYYHKEEIGEIPHFIEGVTKDGEFFPTKIKWDELGELLSKICTGKSGSAYEYGEPYFGDPICLEYPAAAIANLMKRNPNYKIIPDEIALAALKPIP